MLRVTEAPSFWTNLGLMGFNVVTSVGIVFVNKWVFDYYDFRYGTFLTLLHFIATSIGLWVCAKMKTFEVKHLRILDVLPLSLSFCGFVVFNNLSLKYNSVGFYQIMKVMTTPVIVIIQTLYFHIRFPFLILLSLAPVCLGVAMTSLAEVSTNMIGLMFAIAGVLSTSMYQIWAGSKQKELCANSQQLLYYQAPLSSLILIFFVPLFDDTIGSPNGLLFYQWTIQNSFWILVSATLAFAVNLSIFMVIGKTSPVTYNIVGHFKTCVIISGGYIIFHEEVRTMKVLGTLTALMGIFWYTRLKLSGGNEEKVVPRPEDERELVGRSDSPVNS